MRVLQVIGGRKPQPNGRDNIFVRRQVNSLFTLIPDMHIIYAGLGTNIKDMLALYSNLRREIRAFKPNVIHAQYATVTGAVTVLASDNIPTVISYGGEEIYGTYINEYSTLSLRTAAARRFSIFGARRATVCIAKNSENRATLESWGAKRVEEIPNGVDLNLFRELDKQACRAQLGLTPGVQYVVFAVRDNDYVKRRDLAEAAVELCNMNCHAQVKLLILDNVAPNLIPIYLNAGDALLLCSNHEGSPNIVKEALACNRPVVSTDVGDMRERFSSVTGLFLVKKTPEDIAEGLERALRLNKSNGREFVMKLSEEIVAKQLFDLYQTVVGGHT